MSYSLFFSPENWAARTLQERISLAHQHMRTFDRRTREYKRMGWLYVVRNAALKETVFKVGETSRFPTQRVKELSSETGVFGSFDLIYYVHVGERKRAEAYAHELLSASRVSRSKEFFGAPLAQVLQALDETARRFPVFAGTRRKPEPLPQPMLIRSVTCQVCAAEQNVRELLINVRVKCRDCGQEL